MVVVGIVATAVIAVLMSGAGRLPVASAAVQAARRPSPETRLTMIESVFPAGCTGGGCAVADEFAYVLQEEQLSRRQGKRVVRPGEVEYASKGTVHYSLNETKKPARVLVVLLKDR